MRRCLTCRMQNAGGVGMPSFPPEAAPCALQLHKKRGRRKGSQAPEEGSYYFVDMGAICSDPPEVASLEDGRAMLHGLQVQQLLAGSLLHRFSHFPPPSQKQLVRPPVPAQNKIKLRIFKQLISEPRKNIVTHQIN